MTTLERLIIDHVLLVEGGLVNHPSDPGGVTNFGISLRAYPQLGEAGIRALTRDDAARIYYTDYVQKTPSTLPDGFRWFVVDSAVNHGLGRALAWLDKHATLTAYVANRIQFYTGLSTFSSFGRGWMNRIASTLAAINKYEYEHGSTGSARTIALHNATSDGKPIVIRGTFAWRSRGEKLDIRKDA